MERTKDISTIQKLHFILLKKGKVWTFKRLQTTWVTINRMLLLTELETADAILIDKVFDEIYPDGVYDLEYFKKLATLIALGDKTRLASKIGISMYKMKVKLRDMSWKEKEILMIEKLYDDYINE